MKELFEQTGASPLQSLTVTSLTSYMNALIEHGALEGRLGEHTLIPELEPAMEIIHHVLAGARLEIDIRVVQDPDPEIYAELEEKRHQAEQDANALNKNVGMLYVSG